MWGETKHLLWYQHHHLSVFPEQLVLLYNGCTEERMAVHICVHAHVCTHFWSLLLFHEALKDLQSSIYKQYLLCGKDEWHIHTISFTCPLENQFLKLCLIICAKHSNNLGYTKGWVMCASLLLQEHTTANCSINQPKPKLQIWVSRTFTTTA